MFIPGHTTNMEKQNLNLILSDSKPMLSPSAPLFCTKRMLSIFLLSVVSVNHGVPELKGFFLPIRAI